MYYFQYKQKEKKKFPFKSLTSDGKPGRNLRQGQYSSYVYAMLRTVEDGPLTDA